MSDRLEETEAETRRLMAAHAAILPRGFNSARERAHLHRLIDQYLDQHNELRLLAELDTT